MVRLLLAHIFLFVALTVAALDTGDAALSERVRSVQIRNVSQPYGVPGVPSILLSDPDDGIVLDFDILGEDSEYLRYEIIHCNADWQPSSLAYIEYLDGFQEGHISDWQFSNATNVHYIHYTLRLPNEEIAFKVSGNYLLRVYTEEAGPERPLLQVRFCVSEGSVALGGNVTGRTDVDYMRAHQQLELTLDVEHAAVRDPFNDVKLVIQQNGRTDDVRVLTKPLRVSGKRLIYEHLPQLIFEGGNEYRRFEAVSTQYPGMGVADIEFRAPYYHVFLDADQSRAPESYHYDETLSGGYVIREYNSENSDTDADYVVVHFSLDYPATPGFEFYIDGDMVQRRFSPEARMTFNPESGRYERAMLLKQGQYSYQYLAVAPGTTRGRTDVLEGNHHQTRDVYRIYVYTRAFGERYDRLAGVFTLQAN